MNKANISKIIKVLKDDYRSYVCVFKVDGDNKEYVYKEPREKNTRKWQNRNLITMAMLSTMR